MVLSGGSERFVHVDQERASKRRMGGGGTGMVAASMADGDPLTWFRILDEDNSGTLERKEFMDLVHKLDIPLRQGQVSQAFKEMDKAGCGNITYVQFSTWMKQKKEYESRVLRRTIRELWNRADENGDGCLDKQEVARLLNRTYTRSCMENWEPPFDLEEDWQKMCTKGADDAGNVYTGEVRAVTYTEFEYWWKRRNGIEDVDIPVFPEYMVEHIVSKDGDEHEPVRDGKYFWKFLIPRLRRIVSMQQYWGNVHHLYKSHPVSIYSELPLGPCMFDPESAFSTMWDLVQIVLLIYVATTVPFRSGFPGQSTPPGSFWFTVRGRHTARPPGRQAGRQADRQTGRQADRQTDKTRQDKTRQDKTRQTGRQAGRQAGR
eukprot:SAG22_NODE_826_length_6962_cov_20.142358_2_plen_375_part_00